MPGRRAAPLAGVLLVATLTAQAASAQTPPETPPAEPAAGNEELAGQLEGMSEQLQVLQTDTDRLKRFKFSGYIQARWETAENKSDTIKVEKFPIVLTPANNERFYIRRGRVKLTYDASPYSQAVVQIDGGSDRTVRLLDAYLTLFDPWTPEHRHQFTAGQFNVPFGYEIERSSSVRELPERSRAENTLFPGERDRGLKLVSQWTPRLETVLSVINGGGINDANFPTTDPTRGKDLVGRVRWSQGWFDAAVSGYTGEGALPLTGPDVTLDRERLGVDAQTYYELPVLGGGSLKFESYLGRGANSDSLSRFVTVATDSTPVILLKPGKDPDHLVTDLVGWYAMLVQNLGERWQIAGRYEWYDQNRDLEHDQYERLSMAVNWFFDGYTRITLAYDAPKTEVAKGGGYVDPDDNLWTAQFQIKF